MVSTGIRHLSILTAFMVLVGCESGGSGGNASPNNQVQTSEVETGNATLLVTQAELDWTSCRVNRRMECSSLIVPMDYASPDGTTIEIEIARYRVADRTIPRRALLLNPGGPGGSGIGYLAGFSPEDRVSEAMQARFDFISFDPRGIGLSTPVECDLTPLFKQELYSITGDQIMVNIEHATSFAEQCFETHGEYLQRLGSHEVVRDMNEIRKALGVAQIDFLGYSYGTRLAGLYLQTYPESTGRFVLDGSVSPDPSVATLIQGSLAPAQKNFDALARACLGFPVYCLPDEFSSGLRQRIEALAMQPASAESALLFGLLQVATTRPGFEQLLIRGMSAYVRTGDVSELEFLDEILGISESAEDVSRVNETANRAVLCADDAVRPTTDALVDLSRQFNIESDLLAEYFVRIAGTCAGWPEALNPLPNIATDQAPAALVIGGPSDVQTALMFAEDMALAISGQFLRSEHKGHTTVFTGKNKCTDDVTEKFLLSGELPAFTVCGPGASANTTDWHEEFMQAVN